jgi:threonylcarbamoyladenosine tRNA methylthiotransferase MtaB
MRRRYLTKLFREKIDALRNKDPHTFFGIDVIAGFPGETDSDFEDTYRFLEDLNPAYLHIFPYSERHGTDSEKMGDKVGNRVIRSRVKRLDRLSQRLHRNFYIENTGREEKVLFESAIKHGMMYGFTRNYIRTEIPFRKDLANKIVHVKLLNMSDNGNMEVKIIDNDYL